MVSEETTLCPDCGWSGPIAKLVIEGDEAHCPVCAAALRVGESANHD